MPELSHFFGIIIRMYLEAGVPHHTPHSHAYYGGTAAVFSIDPIEKIAGELPRKQQRLVEAWAELHADELKNAWTILQSGRVPNAIEPLK